MKTLDWNASNEADRRAALRRPEQRASPAVQESVRSIVENVRREGWGGLCAVARRIDGEEPCRIDVNSVALEARRSLDSRSIEAIGLAARNIRIFHEASMPAEIAVETCPGLLVRQLWRPIGRVGLYVPGGKTPLFSTLLMLALPALVAGVRQIVAVTPPRPGGGVDPVIAFAADLCGIDELWTAGGAQSIAALAFGAGPIGKVDKICGPGNAWVAEAKRLVVGFPGGPAIDMQAGPSELMVIADESADATVIAADLLSQAEHDAAAQVLLVATSKRLAQQVAREVERQLAGLPRQQIASTSLSSAQLILAADVHQAVEIANLYAPEHLSLAVEDAESLVPQIRNAGAIFAGPMAAEAFGDYLVGSSHVLPTDGAARAWGGVSVHTFLKVMSVQTVTPSGAQRIAAPAALLARMEGLEAHARAADARLGLAS